MLILIIVALIFNSAYGARNNCSSRMMRGEIEPVFEMEYETGEFNVKEIHHKHVEICQNDNKNDNNTEIDDERIRDCDTDKI